jgi:hypothetical protein
MPNFVAILEDNAERLHEMRACLADLLPQYEAAFFDGAFAMVDWLKDHFSEVVLISLDHDLPTDNDHGTGRQVADFLSALPAVCPVIVHTSNEFFAPGMMRVLADGGWPVTRVYQHIDHNWVRDGWTEQVRKYVREGWIFA